MKLEEGTMNYVTSILCYVTTEAGLSMVYFGKKLEILTAGGFTAIKAHLDPLMGKIKTTNYKILLIDR